MSNPSFGEWRGFATEDEARAYWTELQDNDEFCIFAVRIGLFTDKPAEKPVCWIVDRIVK